jgi:outer membrane protein OmpA-like peptidoglycan-associated protein
MNKLLSLLFLFIFPFFPALAADLQGDVCFPKTAEEIVQLRQTGECAGAPLRSSTRQTKGLGQAPQDKGIIIAKDRAGALVQFDYDSDNVKPESFGLLDEWASALKNLGQPMVIAGHADYQGSEDYNQDLSLRRAQAVARYLAGQGVAMQSLLIQAFGESQPLRGTTAYQSDEERYWNRRVEFRWANP